VREGDVVASPCSARASIRPHPPAASEAARVGDGITRGAGGRHGNR
jgi:hypothetical protein